MQVSKTNEDGLTHSFLVTLTADEIATRVEAKLLEIRDQVQLKGFRPGKVPMSHLKMTYGKSVLGEVVEKAIGEASTEVTRSAALITAMQPKVQITKFEEGGDLEFSMVVDALPPIPPIDARSIEVERLSVDISEADVDLSIERLVKSNRAFEPRAEGEAAQSGDRVLIDFVGTVDGVAFAGGTSQDHNLELGSGQFIPGFEEQLIGVVKDDQRDVNVTFPGEYHAADLAGKAAVFAVTVKEVSQPVASVLDDEFAKKFGMETMEALREAARGQVAQEYKRISRARLKRALLDALDKKFDFPLPPSLVEAEFNQILEQVREQMRADVQNQGGDPEGVPEIEEGDRTEFESIAKRRVRLGLLLAEVGRVNNIQVAQEDLNKAIVDQARRYPGQERQIFDYYNKTPEAVAELRAPLFEEKVVDFILELAIVNDRVVTREELLADPESVAAAEDAA